MLACFKPIKWTAILKASLKYKEPDLTNFQIY